MKTQENLILNKFNDACFNCGHIAKEGYLVYMHTFEKDFRRKQPHRGGVEKKMKFTRLIRNKKAISPIFATLILIAIAVIAGIVVYMFTSGTIASMTGGGTAGQEKVAIQAVQINANDTLTVHAQSTGGGPVTMTDAIIKDQNGNVVETVGVTADVLDTLTGGPVARTVALDGSYTVTLVSDAGGSFVSASFEATLAAVP